MKRTLNTIAAVLAVAIAPVSFAANMEGMDMKPSSTGMKAPQSVAAEVRKIDLPGGKITLKHGPIANLGMAGMTMSFPVRHLAQLNGVKEGDKVAATFDMVDGKPTVVDLKK
ncbi:MULTISPECIES: copper-binding protein [Cupriavidus]